MCANCNCGGCKGHGCSVSMITKVLLVIGGINWGLVGIGMLAGTNLNVVNLIFGGMPTIEAIVYLLVGVAAIMKLFHCKCKKCTSGVCYPTNTGSTGGQM